MLSFAGFGLKTKDAHICLDVKRTSFWSYLLDNATWGPVYLCKNSIDQVPLPSLWTAKPMSKNTVKNIWPWDKKKTPTNRSFSSFFPLPNSFSFGILE